ncbi:hypothetical protein CH063_14766 [Colletotrichum higginsianum]|uniref:Uncharacterized protein n=1 Tax=Colletotrichum higginsianum (strain IMI 349063) TaxID=759273 RepID=H1VZZ9_COLHI|nr:hypothetical protein CH063_14766 [Colletotrichum higginsianum]
MWDPAKCQSGLLNSPFQFRRVGIGYPSATADMTVLQRLMLGPSAGMKSLSRRGPPLSIRFGL